MARRTKSTIDDELIDKLLEGHEHSAALLGNDGLIGELKKRLAERMLSAEMDVHLDDEEQQAGGNHRNGYSQKSVTMADDVALTKVKPGDAVSFRVVLGEDQVYRISAIDVMP
jgi:transposase-like protein